MRKPRLSLTVKLYGAFALIILISSLIILVATEYTVSQQFELFVGRSDQFRQSRMAPILAEYYQDNNGWEGVDSLLRGLFPPNGAPNQPADAGNGGPPPPPPENGQNPMIPENVPFGHMPALEKAVLTDGAGLIVFDSSGTEPGKILPADQRARSTSIKVNGKTVGAIFVSTAASSFSARLIDDFLQGLHAGIILAAGVTALLAIIIGFFLLRQITSPLRDLKKAAQSIAGGEFQYQIPIRGNDEISEVAQSFNTMANELNRQEDQRRQMMADISHELRTPLTVLLGQVSALIDGVIPLTVDQLEPLEREVLLLTRLVGDLRDLALADAGQFKLEYQATDLSELLRNVSASFEPSLLEADLHYKPEIPADLPMLDLDSDRFRQVLHNLLQNALRHTPAGGTITLSARQTDAAIRITIQDSGAGIPPEDLPHIFDRFYRGDNNRFRQYHGSGLGLSISRTIIEAHHGCIKAESHPGQGTTFIIDLPLTAA
jgi:signal transduction histidine kinase